MSNQRHPAKHKQQAPINEEWLAVRDFVQKHIGTAITTLLVIAVVVVGIWTFTQRRTQQVEAAQQLLATAQSSSQFEEIIDRFPRSEAAPLAQLSLAKLHFDMGRYRDALDTYQAFQDQWTDHPLGKTAEMGVLFSLEALGASDQIQQAEEGFRAFADNNPDHYLYPQARLGEARCKEQLGRLEEAQAVYESFIESHPDNPWEGEIQERLSELERKIRRQQSS